MEVNYCFTVSQPFYIAYAAFGVGMLIGGILEYLINGRGK